MICAPCGEPCPEAAAAFARAEEEAPVTGAEGHGGEARKAPDRKRQRDYTGPLGPFEQPRTPLGRALLADAKAVSEAGAFAVVLEGIVEPLAETITAEIAAPSIGIGASAACDGQILVLEDMLGLTPRVPRFVKRYGALGEAASQAIADYADEVRSRSFPGPDHVYKPRG